MTFSAQRTLGARLERPNRDEDAAETSRRSFHWQPLPEPSVSPRRGLLAHLTGFLIAYHTA
jgi:hypothetical protein